MDYLLRVGPLSCWVFRVAGYRKMSFYTDNRESSSHIGELCDAQSGWIFSIFESNAFISIQLKESHHD